MFTVSDIFRGLIFVRYVGVICNSEVAPLLLIHSRTEINNSTLRIGADDITGFFFGRPIFARLVGDNAPRGCIEDEGRPLGIGLQEQASKHLKLRWSKAMVLSVKEKVTPDGISWESERRAQANHPMRCRKRKDDVKLVAISTPR